VAVTCIDQPGGRVVSTANREAHLAHIKGSTGSIVQAGPFLDAQGDMCGSLLIYEGDEAGARAWASADPYAAAGLFKSVEIRPWKKVVG